MLLNLLENSALHGETLDMITISLQQNGNMVEFIVEDNGVGIAPDKIKNLFNGAAHSSYQSDSRRNMGIGLSVCRTIVQAHGGTIKGENREAGGARFTVTLPMKEETYED